MAFPTQVSQSGTYYLFATNASGCQGAASQAVNVTVNPQLTADISSPAPYCGPVSRTISATTNATSPSFQWATSANGGSTWSDLTNTNPYSGVTTSSLTINPATGLSGIYYRYTVTSSGGCTATSSSAIMVQEATPYITANPVSTSVLSGSTAYFTVADSAITAATYQWKVSTDSGLTYTPITDNTTYSGSTSTTLAVKNANASLLGNEYEVVITNSCVALSSSPARLSLRNNSALPVTWLFFNAHRSGQTAILSWATATETDAKDFIVNRSTDGINWTAVGNVKAAGNSNSEQKYTFADNNPQAGINYYQIVERDIDGNSTLSEITSVDFNSKGPAGFSVYPNPIVDGYVHIALGSADELNLYNSSGALIRTNLLPGGSNLIDLSDLAKGIYEVKIGNESTSIIIK